MPCLLALLGFFTPRLVLVVLFLFSEYLHRAYLTVLWPLLGFFLMPFTTLAYAIAMNENHGHVSGGWLVLVVFAAVCDVGTHGSGGRAARQRARRIEAEA